MKRAGRFSLGRTIALALALKAALLYGLWSAFFSHPQTKKMRLPAAQVESHLLAAPAPTPTEKVKDGTRR
ncbi:cytochrome oxidase putative small subunit CydP [Pseudoduganella violaceinigra]|uniref:cytochrome oxidase putative small subunit CydP n=1 Tax=Pseudoduganella violaceinigra TaxID=246602 RepID=UPI00040D7A73|nr:cytochrome oxidase putative small subunit CydP [Pseudoduganella violaceinigra]